MKKFKKKEVFLFLGVVVALTVIVVIALLPAFRDKNVVHDTPAVENINGQIIVNPKYNVLTPVNVKDFKKPYCQDIADSRVITVTPENQNVSAAALKKASEKAQEIGDKTTAAKLLTASNAFIDFDQNSTKTQIRLQTAMTPVMSLAMENCKIEYLSHPTEETQKKADEMIAAQQTASPNAQSSKPFTSEEQKQLAEQQKNLADGQQGGVGVVIAPFPVNVNPDLYQADYCTPLGDMMKNVSAGGTQQEVIAKLREGYAQILPAAKESNMKPALFSSYQFLNDYYNANVTIPGLGNATTKASEEYIKDFKIMSDDAKTTCGITF